MPKSKPPQHKLQLEWVDLADLLPRAGNPKDHDLQAIHDSVEAYGFVDPPELANDGKLVAGHGRTHYLQWRKTQGMDPPPGGVRKAKGDRWQVLTVTGVDLEGDQAMGYTIASNRTQERGGVDESALAKVLPGLVQKDVPTGYDGDDLDAILKRINRSLQRDLVEGDNPQAADAEDVNLGDVFKVTKGDATHWIWCGDATDADQVGELLERLELAPEIVLVDPPYSSGGFQEAQRSQGSVGRRKAKSDAIQRDVMSTRGYMAFMAKVLRPLDAVDVVYVFTDWRMWPNTSDAIETAGWRTRAMIVWDKMQMGLGGPWRSQHELIAYGRRSTSAQHSGKAGNVLQFKRDRKNADLHPTVKPVPLLRALLDNTEGQVVVDPLAGSGSTLLAAHLAGKTGVCFELDPAHVATIVDRCRGAGMSVEVAG